MYKLKIRGLIIPISIFMLGISLASSSVSLSFAAVSMPIPLIIIGVLAIFVLYNFIAYSKVNTSQVLILSVLNLLLCAAMSFAALVLSDILYFRRTDFSLIMKLNPVFIPITLVMTGIVSFLFFKFEKIAVTKKVEASETVEIQQPEMVSQPVEEILPVEPPVIEPVREIKQNKEPEFIDDVLETNTVLFTKETNEEKPKIVEEALGDLPSINLDEDIDKKEETPKNSYEFIPDDIRLSEKAEKKETEEKAKICSIGKLLANQKDIENIIEMTELIQQVENDSDGSNVITKMFGEKLKETLTRIQAANPLITGSTITNKAGFAVASMIDDHYKAQTICALASGAFAAVQNYAAKIDIKNPQQMFFETEDNVHILFKVDNFIFYFNCANELEPVNFGALKEFINQKSVSKEDFSEIKGSKGIISTSLSDINGVSSETSDILNAMPVAMAIFENLKVFINNIEPAKLDKILIITDDKTFIIKKYVETFFYLVAREGELISLSPQIKKIQDLIS